MHHFENIFVLEGDVKIHVFGDFLELLLDIWQVDNRIGDIAGQAHHEIFVHDLLADVDDVDIGPGHGVGDTGDDAHLVLAGNGQDTNL